MLLLQLDHSLMLGEGESNPKIILIILGRIEFHLISLSTMIIHFFSNKEPAFPITTTITNPSQIIPNPNQ
jgi:hypothetical protein